MGGTPTTSVMLLAVPQGVLLLSEEELHRVNWQVLEAVRGLEAKWLEEMDEWSGVFTNDKQDCLKLPCAYVC